MTEDVNITLKQGLDRFYIKYAQHLSHTKEGIPQEVKSFFRSHDIAHVLFGCDITLYGEGSVKIWTVYGTTLGFWNHISAYKKANAYELAKSFSLLHVLRNLIKFLYSVPLLIFRAKQMHKQWPWTDFNHYLDRPIHEIRKEFNIKVLR